MNFNIFREIRNDVIVEYNKVELEIKNEII